MPAGANPAAAENKQEPAAKKETKWRGSVVRIYKDQSQMDIRGGVNTRSEDMRKIAYDSSTKWTKGGKPGEQDEVKEGSFVIVLGQVDDKGVLHATRILTCVCHDSLIREVMPRGPVRWCSGVCLSARMGGGSGG